VIQESFALRSYPVSTIAELPVTQAKKTDENTAKSQELLKIDAEVTKRVRNSVRRTIRELPPALAKLYVILLDLEKDGIVTPPMRMLADLMKRKVRSVQRYILGLVGRGLLTVLRRKIGAFLCDTNLFILTKIRGGGGGDRIVGEKIETLKTTTPPVAAPLQMKLDHEARRKRDHQDSAVMREVYELRGRLWAQLKNWRLDKAVERTRMAMKAAVGVLTPPSPHNFIADAQEPRFCRECGYQSGVEYHVGGLG
jgi:hypothetical protein